MFLRVLPLLLVSLALTNANVLQSTIDVSRLQGILQDALKSKDISSLYYAIKGLKQLNAKIPDVCNDIAHVQFDIKSVEQVFYLTNAAYLTGCINSLKPDILGTATNVLNKKDATLQEVYYAVYSLKALNKGSVFDKEDALKNLIQLLKKDDSPTNYGYVFALCEHMGCQAWTASHVEGVLLAADEIDGKALSFEGGLPTTSLLLTTILRSYKTLKKPSPLSEQQRAKFAQYLLSRRSVTSPRGAALLLDAATALADDEPSPISISIKGRKYVTSDADSIEVSVTDLLGRPVRGLKPEEVVAQSGTRLSDDVVVLSKQPLTQKPNEPGTFVLNLSKIKAQYGLYKITLSAGTKSSNLNVAVLGEIQVGSIEVGVGDVDGTTSPKTTTVTYPNKLAEKLQADLMQKVSLKFSVRDAAGRPALVQQAFVRVAAAPEAGQHETIFVAEPDNAKAYKVELSVASIAKHLRRASGAYSLSVYLGDSAAAAPVAWHLGLVHFNFGRDDGALGEAAGAGAGAGAAAGAQRGPRPPIAHTFRQPEPVPARALSDVFAWLCAAPLLLLLALWARLRVNLAHFPFTLSALLFHLSLGASLALYGVLWLRLTMFELARYLLPLAALTFLSGQRLLRRLVQDKAAR